MNCRRHAPADTVADRHQLNSIPHPHIIVPRLHSSKTMWTLDATALHLTTTRYSIAPHLFLGIATRHLETLVAIACYSRHPRCFLIEQVRSTPPFFLEASRKLALLYACHIGQLPHCYYGVWVLSPWPYRRVGLCFSNTWGASTGNLEGWKAVRPRT